MRTAHELGKTLGELCGWDGPMTNRELMAWLSWHECRDEEAERAMAQATGGKAPPRRRRGNLTPEQRAAHSQATWLGFLGVTPEG